MPLYNKDWWKKLFSKKKSVEKIDEGRDTEAVIDFLEELQLDVKSILPDLKKLRELEKEAEVGKEELLKSNLEAQEKILSKVLEKYEFLQLDTDINGLRIKKIAHKFMQNAKKTGLDDLVRKKKSDKKWKMLW